MRNTINGSQQNRAGEPTVVYAVITMDFERPRFRIETTAPSLLGYRPMAARNSSWHFLPAATASAHTSAIAGLERSPASKGSVSREG